MKIVEKFLALPKSMRVLVIVAFLGVFAVLGALVPVPAGPAEAMTADGGGLPLHLKVYAGDVVELGRCIVGVDVSSLEAMRKAIRNKDAVSYNQLASSGLSIGVNEGAIVRVLDGGLMYFRVRFIGGENDGITVWVDRDSVIRIIP